MDGAGAAVAVAAGTAAGAAGGATTATVAGAPAGIEATTEAAAGANEGGASDCWAATRTQLMSANAGEAGAAGVVRGGAETGVNGLPPPAVTGGWCGPGSEPPAGSNAG